MINKADRSRRLTLFGAIYFVEGAMLTYFAAFNVIYLRSFDLSFTRIGIVGGFTLAPFVLKIFIGLFSDRINLAGLGYRRPYIILGLMLQSLAIMIIPLINPAVQFPVFVIVFVTAALGMSIYDTCTDGLSIDTTPVEDRGLVQGIMVGGRALSSVVFAALIGYLSQHGQWPAVFITIGVLGLLTIILVLLVQEPKERPEEIAFDLKAFRSFLDWSFVLFLMLGLVYPLALYSVNGMIGAFINEGLGISLDTVGLYMSVFGVGTIIGAIVGGPLVKRIGRRASITVALILTSTVTFGLAAIPSAGIAWVVVFLFGVAFGYYETVYFAMGMDFSDPRIAAFMFAFIMAVGNIGIGLGQPLAGMLVDNIGFRGMFTVFAVVNLLALPCVYGIFRLRKDMR